MFFLFLICFVVSYEFFLSKKVTCWNDVDFKTTEKSLAQSPIIKSIPFYSYLEVLKSERDNQIKKMFKHGVEPFKNPYHFVFFLDKGVKAFSKKPEMVAKNIGALSAYYFSQLMNFKFVPPTVIRDDFLVQLFVENSMDGSGRRKFLSENLTAIEKSDIYVFYFLFGNLDPHSRHILIGKKCNKVALIDNDWLDLSHIQYGDYPFLDYNYKHNNHNNNYKKGMKTRLFSIDDYKNFPFHKVRSLKFSSVDELRRHLEDMELKINFKNVFLKNSEYFLNQTLYFVKWRNIYWVKMNFSFYRQIWKEFKPTVFSNKTIRSLKQINAQNLGAIFYNINKNYGYQINENFKKSYIAMILYRRDVLLHEAKRLEKESLSR